MINLYFLQLDIRAPSFKHFPIFSVHKNIFTNKLTMSVKYKARLVLVTVWLFDKNVYNVECTLCYIPTTQRAAMSCPPQPSTPLKKMFGLAFRR